MLFFGVVEGTLISNFLLATKFMMRRRASVASGFLEENLDQVIYHKIISILEFVAGCFIVVSIKYVTFLRYTENVKG